MSPLSLRSTSPLSSPPSSVASSSPLSSPCSSPEPPENMPTLQRLHRANPYPSPPASQQTSQTGSPTPDGMESASATDREGPPPAKRRRISRDPKERTTKYLDLRSGAVDADNQDELDRVLNVLHKRQKIVVIAGAGMSVAAGIPDFRSSGGLFNTLKAEHKLKGSGKHLFDASVYKDDSSTSSFHQMVSSMSRACKDAKPTAFHHMIATIADENRLLRLYSQNVDGLDTGLEPLQTRIPLTKDADGKWPRTVQLHGGLDKMICSKCHDLSDLDAELFNGPTPPLCKQCEEVNDIRTNLEGKRSHGIGRLRPRMVLYHEHNPDEEAIGSVTREDLRRRPDAVIVVGTSLKVPGLKRIVREMCSTVRDRKDGGLAIWINYDLPPASKEFEDCFDIVVQGGCDEVAKRAAMRRWNDTADQNDFSEVSEEEAQRAAAKTAEVHVPMTPVKPKCALTHAALVQLESQHHFNNSFLPPPAERTPKQDPDVSPDDWSPMTSRQSSVMPSIEPAGSEEDNIVVADGLLTPSKSQKSRSQRSSPAKPIPSINDRLKDATKSKMLGAKKGKTAGLTKAKPKNVKYVKPATSKAKPGSKARTASVSKSRPLSKVFTTSKTASVAAKSAAKKSLLSPPKSPSKLRQVSNASAGEPMRSLSPANAKMNASPSKRKGAFFPGFAAEHASHGLKRKGLST